MGDILNQVAVKSGNTNLAANSSVFAEYLTNLGLPTQNIIADTGEREIVMNNLQGFLQTLSPDEKRDARYLSKFVGASAVGLFDAALNYVWNEVVINLRKKAVNYGVDLFFDAAVGSNVREFYKSEEDLGGIKDSVLLDTCRKLELVSDVVYLKIHHILTMRNQVAASHPNVESIGGFELLGWLQTCVKDVLQDKPSQSAIQVTLLVNSLRAMQGIIDPATQKRFALEVQHLSSPHLQNLLVTLFGMYVSDSITDILRKNITALAKVVWDHAPEEIKYKIGIMLDGYRTNLQEFKVFQASAFLTIVDGKRYETINSRIIAIDAIVERLVAAHNGWDNFHNEPAVARELLSYIKGLSDIPREISPKLIETVLKCRLGNGVAYCEGVSPSARPLYDHFLSMLDDAAIIYAIRVLYNPAIRGRLQMPLCRKQLFSIIEIFESSSTSGRLTEVLGLLKAKIDHAASIFSDPEFREIFDPLVS